MTRNRPFRPVPALLALLLLSGVAHATPITIDSIGDSFSVNLAGVSSPSGLPVSVTETWLVTGYTPTSVTFQMTFDNTSTTTPAQWTAFGFDASPASTGGTSSSTLFSHVFTSAGGFNVCVENDTNNNCFGNRGNIGLQPGDPVHVFLMTLNFGSTSGGVTLSNFFARLQGIGANDESAKIYGDPTCVTGCTPPPLPEPGLTLLIGGGLAGFLVRARRRAHARAAGR